MSDLVPPVAPAAAPKDSPAVAAAPAAVTPVVAAANPVTPVVPTVPESYTFTAPEKPAPVWNQTEAEKRLTERLKALKVTDAALAQSYLDAAHSEVAVAMEAHIAAHRPDGAAFKAMVDGLTAEALAAPDLGNGDPLQLERKALNAKLVLNRYAASAPKAVQRLTETGMLHDPDILRLLNAVHEATKEPGSPPPSGATPTELSGYAALFPKGVPDFTGETMAPKP